jgi:hypothetical protein
VVWTEVSDLRRQTRLNAATSTDPNAHDGTPLDVLLDNLTRMVEDDAANESVQQPHRPPMASVDRQRLLTCLNDRYRSPCD